MTLSPKFKRNVYRIIPFGVIWLIIGWLLLFSEQVVQGNQIRNPETEISMTLPVFVFASIALLICGWIMGIVEVVVLEHRFEKYRFIQSFLYKSLIYIGFIILVILITYPIAASLESDLGLFSKAIRDRTFNFLFSLTFVSAVVQVSFSIFVCLIYAAVSDNLGQHVLYNFFTGKYHQPVVEERIFLFMDMKRSTTIAERLGHYTYFRLLKQFYAAMSDAIIAHEGEVYEYIGDEVTVTWKLKKGIKNSNCIRCFYAIKSDMLRQKESFEKQFGVFPDFKGAIHVGEVTTGEIGALKKEIVFTGDVLNTTARIQDLCKTYDTDLLVSGTLKELLTDQEGILLTEKGPTSLRGKAMPIKIYACKLDE